MVPGADAGCYVARMNDALSAVVLFEPPGDAHLRGVAAALKRELAAGEPPPPEVSAIALPVVDETRARLERAEVVIALDAASAERARAAGVPQVVLLVPRLDVRALELDVEVDLVLVAHEALAAEAVRRGLRAHVSGPVAPEGWSPAADRKAAKAELGFGADTPHVVVRAGALEDDPAAALVQLSLVRASCVWLFDVDADAELAQRLRQRVPGYGLDASMFADGPDALRCYRAADVVLGALHGPEAIRALAVSAALVAVPPRTDELRLAHALEVADVAEVADAPATLAVTLDRVLEGETSAPAPALDGAERAVTLVRQLVRGELEAAASGLPTGIERLSERDDKPESAPPAPPRSDLDASVDAELAALRKKHGL